MNQILSGEETDARLAGVPLPVILTFAEYVALTTKAAKWDRLHAAILAEDRTF